MEDFRVEEPASHHRTDRAVDRLGCGAKRTGQQSAVEPAEPGAIQLIRFAPSS